jgi:hypothetical protein
MENAVKGRLDCSHEACKQRNRERGLIIEEESENMNGGTYHEALKVGFTERQAGFLGRLGAETRQEAIDCIEQRQKVAAREQKAARRGRRFDIGMMLVALIIGIAIGKAIAQ